MKTASWVAIVCIVIWLLLTIAQLWGAIVRVDIYWKLTITLALIAGGATLVALIVREYVTDSQLKKDKYLD